MEKLTLSVEKRVIERAKRYARARGTSVSRLVEGFLTATVDGSEADRKTPPILAKLRGSLTSGSVEDYRDALARKHR
jgi:hypothetical protein